MLRAATVISLFMSLTVLRILARRASKTAITVISPISLQGVLPDVAWHNNIRAEMWRKLAVNCVINPLTALWNCPNGKLRHPS